MTELYLCPPIDQPLSGYVGPITRIMRQVARETGVAVDLMRGSRGTATTIAARHEAIRRAAQAGYSSSRIGAAMNRDSSVVRAVVRKAR